MSALQMGILLVKQVKDITNKKKATLNHCTHIEPEHWECPSLDKNVCLRESI